MTTLGEELPKEIKRVREVLIPQFQSIGPASEFAILMMQRSLDRATTAMTEGNLPDMISAYKELKDYK